MHQKNSYKVGVRTRQNRMSWVFNGLRFYTKADADKYGKDLTRRWHEVVEVQVVPDGDAPNAYYPVPNDRYPVDREPVLPVIAHRAGTPDST